MNLVRELAGLPKISKTSSQQSNQRKRHSTRSSYSSRRNSSYSQNNRRESFASQRSQQYKLRRLSSNSSRSPRDPTSPASPVSPTSPSNIINNYFSDNVPMRRKSSFSSTSTLLDEDLDFGNKGVSDSSESTETRRFSRKLSKETLGEHNNLNFKDDYISI
ncbi:2117_t:CDS:1 [Acaulospora colombiana]|uniref:2117_t:CDS:1 n=1 Tax=Acaulospora colombiana TaxID=27376 RepID=A0ACA9LL94_9GLOM|nr:2117_t:CDS:1 [Acaulospora colombiana]